MLQPNRRRFRNLTVALLLVGGAAWIVPSYISAERYRRRLQTSLEQTLHRPVKFGSLSFHLVPRPGFSIEDAEVAEDAEFGSEPFARVDRIDCQLRWHSLWTRRMDFAYLYLDHPSFNIVLNSHGEWNVEKLLLQSGVTAPTATTASKAPLAAGELDLQVDDARINFQIGADKKAFAFTDVRAKLQVNPQERRVQFQVVASPVRSDLTTPTPGPVEASGTWTPGADLRGPFEAQLRTRAALLYDWIPVVTGENPQLYGVMDADVHLGGSLPELTVDAEATVSQLHRWKELPPSDPMPWTMRFHGRLLRGNERLQVEDLEAGFADSHLHVSGSVDGLDHAPQVDLVVALERSRLEDVLAAVHRVWPSDSAWNVRGRVDAMLTIQGAWDARRYGGFVGARDVSLDTPSGSFAVSEIGVRINHRGAVLAPVQITLAPQVVLSAQGLIDGTGQAPHYDLQLAAHNIPLHNAVLFGRGMGIHAFQGFDATGSATALVHLTGPAWPPARPEVNGRADLQAARLFVPGLTEALNVPRARLQIAGDQITADPVVAVMGTSVFTAKLAHRGSRSNPWKFDVRANALVLEQGALWFDALGLRRPLSLLERLPALASFAQQRVVASQIFGSLNAEGRFATPQLSYRGLAMKDFQAALVIGGRQIQVKSANFQVAGGRGAAKGTIDFTTAPPALSATASLAGLPLQAVTAKLPGPVHDLRGLVNANGSFHTVGLAREDLAQKLTGEMVLRLRDVSFGEFDALGALAEHAQWGSLEPTHVPVTILPATLNVEIRDRQFILKNTQLDLGGANMQVHGVYTWDGVVSLELGADLQHLRRRWMEREDESEPPPHAEVRLAGSIDHLTVNPPEGMATVVHNRRNGRQ